MKTPGKQSGQHFVTISRHQFSASPSSKVVSLCSCVLCKVPRSTWPDTESFFLSVSKPMVLGADLAKVTFEMPKIFEILTVCLRDRLRTIPDEMCICDD